MNELVELSIDKHGRILVPPALRNRLGLLPGMTLIVEEESDGGIRLRIKSEQPEIVDKDGVLVLRMEPINDLSDVTRRERDSRTDELLHRTNL